MDGVGVVGDVELVAEVAGEGFEVEAEGETVLFLYRPWLVLPARRIRMTQSGLAVGKGLFSPLIVPAEKSETETGGHFVRLPPRFLGLEETLAARLGVGQLRLLGARRHVGNLIDWLRELFGADRRALQENLS